MALAAWGPAPPGLDRAGPLVARRRRREPVAQIIGSREFWGLEFEVTSDVLTPRPETELLVETALARLDNRAAVWSLADVGTGSGCLAVALSHELPRARCVATDISAAALGVARQTPPDTVRPAASPFTKHRFSDGLDGPYDLIVSNPPYIPDHEMATLPPEVGRHEPGRRCAVAGTDSTPPAPSRRRRQRGCARAAGCCWRSAWIKVRRSASSPPGLDSI